MFSPSSLATRRKFLSEILPVSSTPVTHTHKHETCFTRAFSSKYHNTNHRQTIGMPSRAPPVSPSRSVSTYTNWVFFFLFQSFHLRRCTKMSAVRATTNHLGSHKLQKLIEINLLIAILVGIAQHLLDFLLLWLETESAHGHLQFLGVDLTCMNFFRSNKKSEKYLFFFAPSIMIVRTRSVSVEEIKCLLDFVLLFFCELHASSSAARARSTLNWSSRSLPRNEGLFSDVAGTKKHGERQEEKNTEAKQKRKEKKNKDENKGKEFKKKRKKKNTRVREVYVAGCVNQRACAPKWRKRRNKKATEKEERRGAEEYLQLL